MKERESMKVAGQVWATKAGLLKWLRGEER